MKILKKFYLENDNSAEEYKVSLANYIQDTLDKNTWGAMSDYALYLSGAKDILTDLLEVLNSRSE